MAVMVPKLPAMVLAVGAAHADQVLADEAGREGGTPWECGLQHTGRQWQPMQRQSLGRHPACPKHPLRWQAGRWQTPPLLATPRCSRCHRG